MTQKYVLTPAVLAKAAAADAELALKTINEPWMAVADAPCAPVSP